MYAEVVHMQVVMNLMIAIWCDADVAAKGVNFDSARVVVRYVIWRMRVIEIYEIIYSDSHDR